MNWYLSLATKNDGQDVNSINTKSDKREIKTAAAIEGIAVGDVVQLSGSSEYDGYYMVQKLGDDNKTITFSEYSQHASSIITDADNQVDFSDTKPKLTKVPFSSRMVFAKDVDVGKTNSKTEEFQFLNDPTPRKVVTGTEYDDLTFTFTQSEPPKDYEDRLFTLLEYNTSEIVVMLGVDVYDNRIAVVGQVSSKGGEKFGVGAVMDTEVTIATSDRLRLKRTGVHAQEVA